MENAFLILLLCVSISMMGLGVISPIMPMYAESLGATGIWIGLIYSSFSLSKAILMTPIGRMSDVRSKKKIICLGLGIYMIISILYVLAWSPPSIVLIRLAHGAASSMVMPVAMAYVVDLTLEGKEGKYTGMANTALFIGFGAGPLLGGYMTECFSYASTFHLMAALICLGLLLTILFLPEQNKLNLKDRKPRVSLRKILSNKNLQAASVYRFINAVGRGASWVFYHFSQLKA